MYDQIVPQSSSLSHEEPDGSVEQRDQMTLGLLTGDRLLCPFCAKMFFRFLPFGSSNAALDRWKVIGGGRRENAVCPECFSLDRERLVYLYLKEETRIFKDHVSILHVAPEMCLEKVLGNSVSTSYITADLYRSGVMRKLDVTKICFPHESFDVIICNHVLEHVENDRQAMSELYRVLKPQGFAILQVPISWNLRETYEDPAIKTETARLEAFGQADHVRIYGPDYKCRLESAGFEVELYDPLVRKGATAIHQFGLLHGEVVFIGKKPSN